MKSTLKRFLSLMLCMCMVMALLTNVTMTAFAATSGTVTGLADENIGLSFSGDADNAWSASGTQIVGSATSTGGGCSDTHYSSTLTITNNKTTKATLSFDYAIEQNSGTIQVGGTAVTAGGKFSKELEPNASIKVYIKSGSTSAATKITLTNVVLVSDVNATATFVPAENGTYTVDGKLITEEYSNTQSSMTAYQVVATPADGYQFMGWYDVSNEKYISTSAKAALNIENDCTITARFASKTAALFETGGQRFDDLGDAVSYAQENSQTKITLASDGSISGNYTIPTGITLLIPFDEAGTLYTDAPAAIRTAPASKPFRTLTMSEGSSITVNGAISLGGRYYAAGGSEQGRPVGDYGYIKMADNSSITVKNGGNLYAWGFISGSGTVLAESGATVYEFYQIADFRGGSASSGMGHGVFPFSQYFVQNIEVPLTLNAGANEVVYSGVYAMSTTYTTAINFIGDTGMFKVESGSFTKDYDEKTDRLVFTVNGEAALNTLSLKLAGMSVNSASYVLPITNNITINIQSGNVTINQDAALLAGVQVNIAEGAGLTVANGKNIYFYDSYEWKSDNFVWGPCKFKSVAYAPGKAYDRSNNDLVDAKMDVNGSVTAIGAIYTTAGGADICSSNGTGKYIQQGTPGTATATYQYNANANNAVTIPITAAKLHNADGTYTETATANAGDTINYVNGVWGGEEPTELTVTFEANGNAEYPVEGTMDPQTVYAKTDTALNANSFTREGYNFTGWNTEADGTGTSYADGATVNLTENTTLYAQWQFWNGWFTDVNGKQYYKDGELQKTGWTVIDGNTYYLDTETGYAATGITTLVPDGATEEARCVFDAEGVFQSDVTGVYSVGADTYWLNSGIIEEEAGLKRVVKENGEVNYYYFAVQKNLEEREGLTLSAAVKSTMLDGKDCWLHKTNGLALPEWGYYFDENGVILHDEDTGKNGILKDGEDFFYYVDGIKAPAGMIKIGDDYYYANSKGQLIVNQTYYCSRTNGLMPEGIYAFDAEGKLIQGATDKNGIVKDDDGVLRYYVNGKVTYVGLIEIDGDFYYVRSNGEVVTDCVYWITWTHGLKEAGYYTFDENGKLTGTPKNGIVEEDGVLHYYVNGKLTYAGLIKIGDDYYYVNSKCEVVRDCDYYISWTHDLLPQGKYHFDADGKLTGSVAPLKNGIYEEDGSLYFYRNGERAYAGLIQIDGDYYYVRSTCEVVHDCSYYVYWTHGLMPEGYYNFDSAGRMILDSETE
jgi:uncharacterized repeat protein (TIGR02543 family)